MHASLEERVKEILQVRKIGSQNLLCWDFLCIGADLEWDGSDPTSLLITVSIIQKYLGLHKHSRLCGPERERNSKRGCIKKKHSAYKKCFQRGIRMWILINPTSLHNREKEVGLLPNPGILCCSPAPPKKLEIGIYQTSFWAGKGNLSEARPISALKPSR